VGAVPFHPGFPLPAQNIKLPGSLQTRQAVEQGGSLLLWNRQRERSDAVGDAKPVGGQKPVIVPLPGQPLVNPAPLPQGGQWRPARGRASTASVAAAVLSASTGPARSARRASPGFADECGTRHSRTWASADPRGTAVSRASAVGWPRTGDEQRQLAFELSSLS